VGLRQEYSWELARLGKGCQVSWLIISLSLNLTELALGSLGTGTYRNLPPWAQGVVSTIFGTRSWLGALKHSSCSMLMSARISP
jgi:hypothetical protein